MTCFSWMSSFFLFGGAYYISWLIFPPNTAEVYCVMRFFVIFIWLIRYTFFELRYFKIFLGSKSHSTIVWSNSSKITSNRRKTYCNRGKVKKHVTSRKISDSIQSINFFQELCSSCQHMVKICL